MELLLEIFEKFGLPVALIVVLVYSLCFILKRELKQNDDAARMISEVNEKHIKYMQDENKQLTSIIADNTRAFNELIEVLKEFKNTLKC